MNLHEAKRTIAEMANKLIERPEGVATMELVNEFKQVHGTEMLDLGAELVDDWLRRVCRENATRVGSDKTEQLTLPGIGDVDAFVTIPDGEGGFRRKKYIYASTSDILANAGIEDENERRVVHQGNRRRQRDELVLTVMEEHGFDVAGDAIRWLNDNGEPPR